ncbi:hypothetical protein EW146_g10459 [Bondarzewia mesenterica]|uniref:Uncharacterized protein n=1 Tax=Bondarzewia mesenterica TaxID=1095465 RepID=A0A4S4KX24_9AGAM|nr:hypothetical protein EW146_g10459 [Bondarzewia mesenterica]
MFSRASDISYSYTEALRQQPSTGVAPSLQFPAANYLSLNAGTNMTVDEYKIPVVPQRHRQTEDYGVLLAGDPVHRPVFPAYLSNDAYGTFS